GDHGVRHADVILPGAAYTEKSGTYVNTEGRVQRGVRAAFAPGDAREGWTILRALSDVVGHRLPFDSIGELRAKMEAAAPVLATLDVKPVVPWGNFGTAGSLSAEPLAYTATDFYMTNPICRASEIMADCREAMSADQLEA